MMNKWFLGAMLALWASGCGAAAEPGPAGPAGYSGYQVWVTSESADLITMVHFDRDGARIVDRHRVGVQPVEIDAPHGIAIAPDGRHLYVTLGHGTPFGWLQKLDAATGVLVDATLLDRFPATVSVTPDGEYGFVSNFNLHGDPVTSSISKVHLSTMEEVARTETCVMPHGSRVNSAGTRHYSVCMMDDLLVEIDVTTGEVDRVFSVHPGSEGPASLDVSRSPEMEMDAGEVCSPTWIEPSVDGSSLFVTCNAAAEVLEIDADRWTLVRRFSTGDAPYNLGVSPDGRFLLVSLRNRTDPALEVFDLTTGDRAGRVRASTTLVHGIAVTEDSRYVFITAEGVGSEPGRVDVIDLGTLERVASVEVAQQATGIALVPGGG